MATVLVLKGYNAAGQPITSSASIDADGSKPGDREVHIGGAPYVQVAAVAGEKVYAARDARQR